MGKLIKIENFSVVWSPDLVMIGEFGDMYKKIGDKEFGRLMGYIYYGYSQESYYRDLPLKDRQKRALMDSGFDYALMNNMRDEIGRLVEIYLDIEVSSLERLLIGIKKKIDEYLVFWNDTGVNANNHNLIADQLINSEKLIKVYKDIEDKIKRERSSGIYGGGVISKYEE